MQCAYFICLCNLNVGIYFSRTIFVVAKYVIRKHELYSRILERKGFDWLVPPDNNVDNLSASECNSDNFTFYSTHS